MKTKNFSVLLIIFSMAFLILAGTIGYSIVQKKKESQKDPFDYTNQQALGDKDAPVQMVEFGDFKCPACRTWDATVFPQLKKDYIDTGKVQLHFINFAFIGKDSDLGAQAGEAIYKQNKAAFWKFYDEVYQSQKSTDEEWLTEAFLIDLVKTKLPEINLEQFKKDLNSKEMKELVQKDKDIALKLSVQGAPTVYVNGKPSNPDYDSLKKAIEQAAEKK
ncbi:DsbA family protein [Ectobacillus panaciterrae]|uniref:DsbA family protein n=1 Tax=Ectobacillus panaciterrae TaxID=363872 RepID=UPI0004034A52|nr:thioredoxin domain-containing protein [Ectobacillus panaciterrae]